MDRLNLLYLVAAVILSMAFGLVWLAVRKKLTPHELPLPPGPKGLPFFGCAFQVNKNEPWLTYTEWKKTYGDIVSCKSLGQTIIIINSERVAKTLLEQRANNYSDRPVIRASALLGLDFNTGHLPCDDTWKSHRKMYHQSLNSSIIHKHHESIIERVQVLLENLLQSPEKFSVHTRSYSTSVIMSITYGYNVVSEDDPFIVPIEEILVKITYLMMPERAIVLSHFPQLFSLPSWLFGGELRRLVEQCKELSPRMRDIPFRFVKECLSKDIENGSMVAQFLEDKTAPGFDRASYEQNVKDCAASSFIAGTDTTQSTLNMLIMLLVLYPKTQERAHTAIDSIIGRGRLPTFHDRASLQYIDALLRETLRWGAIVPLAVPHRATKDDVFEQRLIPKGSIVIANLWAMARDEDRFPDPRAFKPERHLDEDGNLLQDDVSSLYFGYGRRICPGRYLASASTWLAAANMLAMFKFSKAIGAAGYEIDIFPKFIGGSALRPAPFTCRITPRFEGAADLLSK